MIRHHPDDSLLMAQAAGRLDSGSALVLASHAENCEQCRERLRSFDVLGGALLEQLESLPIAVDRETDTHAWHATRTLSQEQGLTPYDAAYLELAIRLGLPLATGDRELIAAAQRLGVTVLTP